MKFTLERGQRYSATLKLGMFEGMAPNEMVKEKLEQANFTHVQVTGAGRTREASGVYNGISGAIDLPSQIDKIRNSPA